MDRRPYALIAVALTAALLSAQAAAATLSQRGQWALQSGTPQITSRMTVATSAAATRLDIVQTMPGSAAPIGHYTIEQTKVMHLILVRDDFRQFNHLHPELRGGHFTIPVALAAGHRYYIYADSKPAGLPQQVFRFIAGAGVQPRTQQTPLSASNPVAPVGPYVVRLSATRVPAHRPATLYATITRDGKLAADIHPYLGAAAHIVLVNTSTLTYAHVHPGGSHADMDMPMSAPPDPVDPKIAMRLPPLGRHAAYKLWLQFQGAGTVSVAPFTIVAAP